MTENTTDTSPIIFIPGILGSRLYLPDGQLVWFSITGLNKNSDKLSIENELTVKNNHINQNELSMTERERGSAGLYIVLINKLCLDYPSRKIFFFSYDYRRSCSDIAEKLKEDIEYIKKYSSCSKVDIVAHSMGGLVTASYAEKYGTDDFNKVITLGTPYEGAPNAIPLTITGDFFGIPKNIFEQSGITREMVMKYPGVIELFPSEKYIDTHPFSDVNGVLTTAEVDNILENTYGEIYTKSREKILSRNNEGVKKVAEMNNSYFAVGNNRSTSLSVIFKNNTAEDVKSREGDGIVPYDSAAMFGYLKNLGKDETGRNRFASFSVRHNNLLIAPECINWILDILK